MLITVLFVVIFLVGGASLTYYTGIRCALRNHQVKQSWEKVPCEILSLKLETVRKRRARRGGGSNRTTTYRVKAEYTYEYQGKQYAGDTYGFGSKLSTAFHKMTNNHMAAVRSQENPVCFVNPDNPEEAILDPTLNPASMIVSGAGVLLMLCGVGIAFKSRSYLIKKSGTAKSVA